MMCEVCGRKSKIDLVKITNKGILCRWCKVKEGAKEI